MLQINDKKKVFKCPACGSTNNWYLEIDNSSLRECGNSSCPVYSFYSDQLTPVTDGISRGNDKHE